MICPTCAGPTGVTDSRAIEGGTSWRRRRRCQAVGCGARFTTYEMVRNEEADPAEAGQSIGYLLRAARSLSQTDLRLLGDIARRLGRGDMMVADEPRSVSDITRDILDINPTQRTQPNDR